MTKKFIFSSLLTVCIWLHSVWPVSLLPLCSGLFLCWKDRQMQQENNTSTAIHIALENNMWWTRYLEKSKRWNCSVVKYWLVEIAYNIIQNLFCLGLCVSLIYLIPKTLLKSCANTHSQQFAGYMIAIYLKRSPEPVSLPLDHLQIVQTAHHLVNYELFWWYLYIFWVFLQLSLLGKDSKLQSPIKKRFLQKVVFTQFQMGRGDVLHF